jgi:transposase-like protein
MDKRDYRDYFAQPVEALHRRYEAIRCVLFEEQPMKGVARRFGVSYGTVRNWVSEFCRTRDTGQSPPFFLRRCVDAPRPTVPRPTMRSRQFKPPMFGRCR